MIIPIFEIKLDDEIVQLEQDVWDGIQYRIRENKWFYLIYKGVKYKYSHDRQFLDRSTLFYFDSVDFYHDDEIEIIEIPI